MRVVEPGVGIVDDAALLVLHDSVAVDEPFERRPAVDFVPVGFGRNAGQAYVFVDDQHGSFVIGESHRPSADAEVLRSRFSLSRENHVERVFLAVFVTEVQIHQCASGLREGMEIGCEGNARQRLRQIVGKAFPVAGNVEDSVGVIEDRVLRDRIVTVVRAESGEGRVGHVVDALRPRRVRAATHARKLILGVVRLPIPVSWEMLSFRDKFEIGHRIHREHREGLGRSHARDADRPILSARDREDAVHLILVVHQYVIDVAILLDERTILGLLYVACRKRDSLPLPQVVLQLPVPPDVGGMEACDFVYTVLRVIFGDAHGPQVIFRYEPRVLRTGVTGEVVEVGVSAGCTASTEQREYRVAPLAGLHVLRSQGVEPLELLAALADPVVLRVRRDLTPVLDAGDGPRLTQDRQLFLALEVVADVAVQDAAAVV